MGLTMESVEFPVLISLLFRGTPPMAKKFFKELLALCFCGWALEELGAMVVLCATEELKEALPSTFPIYGRPTDSIKAGLEDGPRAHDAGLKACLLYTSPSPRDATLSRMPSSA